MRRSKIPQESMNTVARARVIASQRIDLIDDTFK